MGVGGMWQESTKGRPWRPWLEFGFYSNQNRNQVNNSQYSQCVERMTDCRGDKMKTGVPIRRPLSLLRPYR